MLAASPPVRVNKSHRRQKIRLAHQQRALLHLSPQTAGPMAGANEAPAIAPMTTPPMMKQVRRLNGILVGWLGRGRYLRKEGLMVGRVRVQD